jgi:hypothetical protein
MTQDPWIQQPLISIDFSFDIIELLCATISNFDHRVGGRTLEKYGALTVLLNDTTIYVASKVVFDIDSI